MSTTAQIAANKLNAQHSTGPKTEAGKAASALNHFRHGLAGSFMILDWEHEEEFDELLENLRAEHQPATPTEVLLVESMAQHYWLKQRAIRLQYATMEPELPTCPFPKELAIYIRYQTTHERAFYKALNELLRLRAEKRKAEIGFESQTLRSSRESRVQAAEIRKEANEKRRDELHTLRVSLATARLRGQELKNVVLERPELRNESHAQGCPTTEEPARIAA